MAILASFFAWVNKICPFSKCTIKLGFYLMLGYYITALISTFFIGHTADTAGLLTSIRGLIECAPGCFVAGFVTGFICDLVYKHDVENK